MIAFSLFFSSRGSPPRILLVSLVRRAVVVIVVVASGRRHPPVPSSSRRHRLKALRSFLFVPPREKIESKPSSNPELHLLPVWLFFSSLVGFLSLRRRRRRRRRRQLESFSSSSSFFFFFFFFFFSVQKDESTTSVFSLIYMGKRTFPLFLFPFFFAHQTLNTLFKKYL